ncbi:ankyrin repeat-containing domain protein [Aspergillus varians]
MGFLNLPNELILLLTSHLEYEYEINALCRTTRWLHELLNPILYKHSITQRKGGYMLEWAAINGSASTARLILETGAPPGACGGECWQPFALAAMHGHSEIIGLLYEHGVDPLATDNDWKNHLDDDPDVEDWEEGHPLSMAASNGHVSVVNLLLKYGVPPDLPTGNFKKRTALHLAAEQGHLDVVRVLVDAGSPINAQDGDGGVTPLELAALEDHLDIVQFLVSRGADPNMAIRYGGTSLCLASYSADIEIVRCLLDGATLDPFDPDGQIPLFQLSRAAEGGYDDIAEFLLTRFDYVQSSTGPYEQATLLCVAALTGRTTLLADLLTNHNYDPDLCITDGRIFAPYTTCNSRPYRSCYSGPRTALTLAAEHNQPAAIDVLLSHGASITLSSGHRLNNDTPLLCAIKNGHKAAVATLLAHGANPNNPPGEALFAAVTNPPIFSLLLFHNADPTIPLPNSSLLAHTLFCGNVNTLRILLDHPKGLELVVDPLPVRSADEPEHISFFRAAVLGGEGVFRLLLDRGLLTPPRELDPRTARDYLLHMVPHGDMPLMRLLLDMEFDVHAGDDAGSMIYRATQTMEDPEGSFLDFLLQNGCSIDDTDVMGRTALVMAACEDQPVNMRLLLERGADPLFSYLGDTILSVAARAACVDAVEVILGVFDERGLGLGEVEGVLKLAEKRALEEQAVEDHTVKKKRADIVRMLRQFYWRRRYPVSSL